jgi:hypothetical protein
MPLKDIGESIGRAGGGAMTPPDGPRKHIPLLLVILLAGAIPCGVAAGYVAAHRPAKMPPVVDKVTSANFADAMTTLSAEGIQQAQEDPRECRLQLGYITVATPGNPAGGTVRFRTSRYESPPFVVSDKPQRIAIPNPFPVTGGTGPLSVDGDAKGLVVALTPPTLIELAGGREHRSHFPALPSVRSLRGSCRPLSRSDLSLRSS